MSVALDLVAAALSPVGPGTPAEDPLLLVMLAWARREFAQDFAPPDIQQVVTAAVSTTPGEDRSEDNIDDADFLPYLGNFLHGVEIGVNVYHFVSALAAGNWEDVRDEAGDIAGNVAGLLLPWPLSAVMDDVLENWTKGLIGIFPGAGDATIVQPDRLR